MKTDPIFGEVPIGDLFVTGPSESLFIKVDNDGDTLTGQLPTGGWVSEQLLGGNAFDIASGRKIWFPAVRNVRRANNTHFHTAYYKYTIRGFQAKTPVPA